MSVATPPGQKKELGQILIQQGLLTPNQLNQAVSQQKSSGKPLGQLLVDLGLVGEEDVTKARAQQADMAYIRIQDLTVDKSVLPLVDAAVAHKHLILPVGKTPDGTLKIVVGQWNMAVMDAAQRIAAAHRLRIAPALATEAHLRSALEHYYDAAPAASSNGGAAAAPGGNNARHGVPAVIPPGGGEVLKPPPATPAPLAGKRPSEMFAAMTAPARPSAGLPGGSLDEIGGEEVGVDQPIVIQFVNRILADAIVKKASDIHFEPRRDSLVIRYRIDGTLHQIDTIPRQYQSAISSRLKIMAEMNIAERRLPQDGRIAVTMDGRAIDMRVSSLPTQFGESVVLRILDKSGARPDIDQLGFSPENLKKLNSIIRKPHGIFLATGPTGSGKTTTLYSAIHAIHNPDINIITCEDPIEYHLEGIRQSNVNEKAGLTFAKQLRSILRQDPDVIYVGEIRDAETAEIAFRAALTGHLVFSTLHCNDAAGAVTRLLNMGIDPFLVASSVIGILAQRLVRRICTQCARPMPPSDADLVAFGVDTDSPEFLHARFMAGTGCEVCGQTGYKGRASVQELLVMDDAIRAMVLQRQPSNKIRRAAIARGMASMRKDAASKVMQGITTFEEAQKRVYIEDEVEELPAY
ncbi:MAG: Flp pilus assembly complex ATPase component TadA [Armatimonadetes bacterium]|nr:Flp pilus assembly complex ATPase component TadA [Armatimonadota bacterium]